jgi:hypothetical protein
MRAIRNVFLFCAAVGLMVETASGVVPFIGGFSTITPIASTVPHNGDVNPYGVAVSPVTHGKLIQGHVLVSNFNNKANEQGTGTTIVQIGPGGAFDLFAQIDAQNLPGPCPGGVGLTTALVVLRSGWVIVGSLPTIHGNPATSKAGCLIVLNDQGKPVETISGDLINGPWDMTAFDGGTFAVLFVTNVLNGTVAAGGATVFQGTVVRLTVALPNQNNQGNDNGNDNDEGPRVIMRTKIGSGFGEHTDPTALVVGPTGVGLGLDGSLFVADTVGNGISKITDALTRTTDAGTGTQITSGLPLNGPLGLVIAPNGDILAVNSLDGKIVETTTSGSQVASFTLDNTVIHLPR